MGLCVCFCSTSGFATHYLGHLLIIFFTHFFIWFHNRFDASVSVSGMLTSSNVGVSVVYKDKHTSLL